MIPDEFLYLRHDDPGPLGWQCRSDITHVERGVVFPHRLAEIPGARNEHVLFRRSAVGRYSPAEWKQFTAKLSREGVLSPIELEKDAAGQATIFEGNHRMRAALALGLLVPVVVRYECNSQRSGVLFPDVQRIALPSQVVQYAALAVHARAIGGKRGRSYRTKATQLLISLPAELRALSLRVAVIEGAYSPP